MAGKSPNRTYGESSAAAPLEEKLRRQKWQWVPRFAYEGRSTRAPQASRPDYLRDLFRRTYVRTIEESAGQLLDSATNWFIGTDAAFYMAHARCCSEGKRSVADAEADGINGIVFDYLISGQYTVSAGDACIALTAGDLTMVQTNIEVIGQSRYPHLSSVFIPRYRIVEALGTDASGPGFILRTLNAAPLAPFVVAAIHELAKAYGNIPTEDFDAALGATAGLLLRLLRRELDKASVSREPGSAAFDRALAYMEQHHRNPELSPEKVAQGIGVSRARLYKLFAQNSLTVGGYLRELRLHHFVAALRTADEAAIGQLAWSVGFDMRAADFARVFKRGYGMTPREAHLALRAGRSIVPASKLPRVR